MILRQRQPRIEDANHLKWIRTLPCLISGTWPDIHAAHIRYGDARYDKRATGLGEKPDDRWVVPLSAIIHMNQHTEGEKNWWWAMGIDPLKYALELYKISGNTAAAEKIMKELR